MRYVCLGYMDAQSWDALSLGERGAFLAECRDYGEVLAVAGHIVAREAIDAESSAGATLRIRQGGPSVDAGCLDPAGRTLLRGILVIEANDMNHSIQLLARHPAVRRGGVVEVRPASPLPRADAS